VGRLRIRGKYLGIKGNAHELLWDISAFLLGESKSLKKELVDLSLTAGTVKEIDRGEGEFRTSVEKSKERSEISPRPDSSIISLISNFKIF
jgi:hypothetical protein